ncbi:MAG: NlpC/P60 family protein [Pseudomonadota bacterium]
MDGAEPLDPRLHPVRDDLAAAYLRGRVSAKRFEEATPFQVTAPVLDLRATPGRIGGLASQLLAGERFDVYESDPDTGLAWGQNRTDGYVGYVSRAGLDPVAEAPTHRVNHRATHCYPAPNMKTTPLELLPRAAQVAVSAQDAGFALVGEGTWVPLQHLTPLAQMPVDPVEEALAYLGTPYLWGGRSAFGLDCSALAQLAYGAVGVALLRDSDQQAGQGVSVARGDLGRGDLVFWKGHVGLMVDGHTLLHANAHHMSVAAEPLVEAEARIAAAGDGAITGCRRVA